MYLSHLAQQYVKVGHNVTVVVRFASQRPPDSRAQFVSFEEARVVEENGIRIVIVAAPKWSRPILPLLYKMRFHRIGSRMARFICERTYHATLRSSLAGCDIIHYSGTAQEPLGLAAAIVAKEMAVPFVVTPHTHAGVWGDGADDFEFYKRADRMIALTRNEQDRLVDGGLEAKAISVVMHGADRSSRASRERFRSRYAIDGPTVLFVGRKTREKGYQLLLDAAVDVWKFCPSAMFVLAGPHETSEQFSTQVLADRRIVDVGVLTDEERDDAYAGSDVVCVPSENEAFGLVYMEAWAFSKPVVGLRIPTLVELVDGAGGGILTDGSSHAVAEVLVSLLTNPDYSDELGKAGNHVASKRNWSVVARDTLNIYSQARAMIN